MKALRVLGVACACALLGAAPPRTTYFGYTPAASDRERTLETTFLDIPSAQGALDAATVIAAHPHDPGSYGDQQLAAYMRDKLHEYGFEVELETLTAQVDSPRRLGLSLLAPSTVAAEVALAAAPATPVPASAVTPGPRRGSRPAPRAARVAVPAGPTPSPGPRGIGGLLHRNRGPVNVTFNLREGALPGDDATTVLTLPFNAGSPDGNVTAPLVYASHGLDGDYDQLARHDVDVRGAVVLIRYGSEFRGTLAARAQARGAGAVIFYNDPEDDGYARGPVYPAGPWRPPTSVERGTVGTGITIPTLPVTAANAQVLLAALRGPGGAKPWAGALPVAYPYARGPGVVHLTVQLRRRTMTLWNTIGRLRGTRGDQSVILGAHRDAAVAGVGDNGSGVITMLELARGLGYLAQNGWRPLRTIVIAGWDGGEIGSAGSIAYVKRHRDELVSGGVAYLNADESAVGPRFEADAAAAIGPAISDAAREVDDPANASRSIYDQWAFEQGIPAPFAAAPGGGSDHASFLFDVGTPVANMSFTGPLGGYHSSYDTLQFATTMSDPGFVRHRAIAQLYGVLAMRLADGDAVPYTFAAYVPPMRGAIALLTQKATTTRTSIDLSALQATVDAFAATAARFDALTARAANADSPDRALEAARVLDLITYGNGTGTNLFPDLDRALTSANGATFAVALTRTRNAIAHAGDLLNGAPGMVLPPTPAPAPTRRPAPRRR